MLVAAAGTGVYSLLSGHQVKAANPGAQSGGNSPALVELFTSEGCSSCPPADALLAKIARERPNAIVLSEHVDYWNYIGWKDPYSSASASERQREYGRRFQLESVYTPQMVIDGRYELVGNDQRIAYAHLEQAAATAKIPVTLSEVRAEGRTVDVHIAVPPAAGNAKVYAVLAQNSGSQVVDRGENGGRTLTHVSIARTLKQVGSVSAAQGYAGDVQLPLPQGQNAQDMHVVAFVQQPGGPVIGVASAQLPGSAK